MMKRYLLTLLFTYTAVFINAQSEKITISNSLAGDLEYIPEIVENAFLKPVAEGIYYASVNKEYIATAEGSFSNLLENISNKDIVLPGNWNDEESHQTFILTIGTTVNYIQTFKVKSKIIVMHSSFDLRTHEEISLRKTICEYEFASKKEAKSGSWGIKYSEDKSKILLRPYIPNDKKGNQIACFFLFDDSFELLREENTELDYEDDFYILYGYRVNNQGKVWLMGKNYRKHIRKVDFSYEFSFFVFEPGNSAGKEIVVEPSAILNRPSYKVSPDGDLICAALFDDEKEGFMDGTWILKIDGKTDDILMNTTSRLIRGGELFGFSPSHRYAARNIESILTNEDGSLTLICDNLIETQKYGIDRWQTNMSTGQREHVQRQPYIFYESKSMRVIKLDPDGEVIWNTRIKKHQSSKIKQYMGPIIIHRNGHLHFIFYDNRENENYVPGVDDYKVASQPTMNENFITMVSLDQEGIQTRNTLINEGKQDVSRRLWINKAFMLTDDELVLPFANYKAINTLGMNYYTLKFRD